MKICDSPIIKNNGKGKDSEMPVEDSINILQHASRSIQYE